MATKQRTEEIMKICGFRPDDQMLKDLSQIRFNIMMMAPNLVQLPVSLSDKLFSLNKELNNYLEVIHTRREKELNGE